MKKNLLLLLFLSLAAKGQIVNIPDANFKAKLLSADVTNTVAQDVNGNNIKIDNNNNGEIELAEALVVRKLFYTSGGNPPFKLNTEAVIGPISDLTGIAAFTNLIYLNVTNNQLTTLDVSNNLLLTQLLADGNLLNSVNVSGLTNLAVLFVANNQLTSLDTSSLVSLGNLQCQGNAITTLDLSLCTQLKYLDCNYNELSVLDLSNSPQLIDLRCYSNNITSLSFNAPNTLIRAHCSNNQITSPFNFNGYTALVLFECTDNQITSLTFGNNTSLYQVWCAHNNINTLDFSGTSLFRLSCGDNPNLSFLNVKNGVVTPDLYVSQFPEPPFTEDSFKLPNTPSLLYICHDEGEFGPELVANEGLEDVSRGTYCSFIPGGSYNTISGNVIFDCGGNNTPVINHNINVVGNSQSGTTFTNSNGLYQFYSDGTTVTVTPQFANPNYFTVTPANYTFNFVDFGNTETANFCVTANGVHTDLEVSILPLTPARPGFDAKYKIIFKNNGNQMQSGVVTMSYDARVDFINAVPTADLQSGTTVTWNFVDLLPFEIREIQITVNVNAPTETPPVNIDDILLYTLNVSSLQTDETPDDNSMSYNQVVVGSFDPNDKQVVEGPYIPLDHTGDYLHYIVRFQNTGTAEAENIVIKDVLDSNLDWNTLQMVSSSHPYRSTLTSGNKLEVFYEGINLPASSVNEPASHGYIAFKIKPKPTLVFEDVIENKANIYFDYNLPIVTNTVSTMITGILGTSTSDTSLFKVYPNPTSGIIHIQMNDNQAITKVIINNLLGQTMMISESASELDISSLTKGTYFITVQTDNARATQKMIKL